MTLDLDDARRAQLVARLQAHYLESFDEELSAFRAEQLLELFLAELGPQVYNQAVQDARKYMQEKLDDLDVEVHEPDRA